MRKPVSNILVIPPEELSEHIVPEAMAAYLDVTFPRFAFAVDTRSPYDKEYYCFVILPTADGCYEEPTEDECREILIKLRDYGDGKKMLH